MYVKKALIFSKGSLRTVLTRNKGEKLCPVPFSRKHLDNFFILRIVFQKTLTTFTRGPKFSTHPVLGWGKSSKNFLSANTFNPGVGEKVQKTFYLQTRFTLTPCLLQGWEGTTQYWGGIQISSPKLLRPCSRPILGREGIIQTRPPNGVKSGPHPVLGWGNFPVFFWHLQSCPMRGQPQIQSFLRQWICYV